MILFRYSKRKTVLHSFPCIVKFLIMISVSIMVCFLDVKVNLIIFTVFILLSQIGKVSVISIIKDMLPIIWYSVFILLVNVLSALINSNPITISTIFIGSSVNLIVRLFVVVLITSVFLRTTSMFDLYYAFKKALPIVLFFNFFTRIFSTWDMLSKVYKARGGKNGIKKVVKLLPVLISIGIKKANDTYLSLYNRSKVGI